MINHLTISTCKVVFYFAGVAQLEERMSCNHRAEGSNPSISSSEARRLAHCLLCLFTSSSQSLHNISFYPFGKCQYWLAVAVYHSGPRETRRS